MSENLPLVSVIVPNYNHESELNRRIKSILEQTYRHIEIILLDDCSKDQSTKVLLEYKEHPLVSNIVINETNSGSTFKQWQKGFQLARGEWIWIAESDDHCEPTFLENMLQGIRKDQDIRLAYCQSILFNGHQITERTIYPLLEDVKEGTEWIGRELFGRNNLCNASMAIFKKAALEKIDWRFIDFKFCGDWFFWTQIALVGKVYVSGKYLNYYNKHSNNVSNKAWVNGLYYTEGREVMAYILQNVELAPVQQLTGLTVFVNQFINDEDQFASKKVWEESWQALLTIDPPLVKAIYRSLTRQRQIEKLKSKLKFWSNRESIGLF